MPEHSLEGSCMCGDIRYRITGPYRNLCACHCQSCRRAAGAPYLLWATVPEDNFELIRGEPSIYSSSAGVRRGFCQHCGTTLTYAHQARAGELDITVASLDEPDALPPRFQIFVIDKLASVKLDPDLPAHTTVPGAET